MPFCFLISPNRVKELPYLSAGGARSPGLPHSGLLERVQSHDNRRCESQNSSAEGVGPGSGWPSSSSVPGGDWETFEEVKVGASQAWHRGKAGACLGLGEALPAAVGRRQRGPGSQKPASNLCSADKQLCEQEQMTEGLCRQISWVCD